MQEGQLLLCWVFIPINIQQVPLPLQGIYFFLLLFLNMYTHKFKVFTNTVYSVITSEVVIRWFWQKLKKIKEHSKIKSFTVQLVLFSLIILVTFHTIFASFYFALVQYIHNIDWNTLNLEMAVWSGDLPSLLMARRVLQKVLSLDLDYFSATFYQTYLYYKHSKYSPFTETYFCNLFTQSRKADK